MILGIVKRIKHAIKAYGKCYVAVDIHGTVLKPTFAKSRYVSNSTTCDVATEYYPFAKRVLKTLSKNENISLILWTSSYNADVLHYLNNFAKDGITFSYVNENPECENGEFACFDDKMYFDVGLDDRFGFNPYLDWAKLYVFMKLMIKNKGRK